MDSTTSALLNEYILALHDTRKTSIMLGHGVTELVCSIIAVINIIAAVVLYKKEILDGITVKTGTRRKAIMTCVLMCLISGALSLLFMMFDIATHNWS